MSGLAYPKNLLLALCFAGCLLTSAAYAEVIELGGTVKSIDKEARTISVVYKSDEGEKVLDLQVAEKAGDLSTVRPGQTVSLSYDTDLRIMTRFRKPMPARQLHKAMRTVHEHERNKSQQVPAAVAHESGFVFGYLMGVGDALGNEVHMPVGPQARKEFDAKLLQYLEDHPEKADQPACDVIRVFLDSTPNP